MGNERRDRAAEPLGYGLIGDPEFLGDLQRRTLPWDVVVTPPRREEEGLALWFREAVPRARVPRGRVVYPVGFEPDPRLLAALRERREVVTRREPGLIRSCVNFYR